MTDKAINNEALTHSYVAFDLSEAFSSELVNRAETSLLRVQLGKIARIALDYLNLFDKISVVTEDNLTATTVNSDSNSVTTIVADSKSILQEVFSVTTTNDSNSSNFPSDDTIPQNTEGKELFNISITPVRNNSRFIISGTITMSSNGASPDNFCIALFRDNVASAFATFWNQVPSAQAAGQLTFTAITPSGITWGPTVNLKLRYGGLGGTDTYYINRDPSSPFGQFFGGTLTSSITIREVKA